jgi:hypothetical protein
VGRQRVRRRPLARGVKTVAAITVEVVRRTSAHSFQIVRHRWVVERTFGWLTRYRRLARDYERRAESHEAMVYWATVFIMTKRLARYEPAMRPPSAGAATASQPGSHPWRPRKPFYQKALRS